MTAALGERGPLPPPGERGLCRPLENRGPLIMKNPIDPDEPAQEKKVDAYGCMKGTVEILGDLIEPIDVIWEADQES